MVVLRRKAILCLVFALVLLFAGIWSLQLGDTPVKVVVAARTLKPFVPLTDADLAVSSVPRRYVGPESISDRNHLLGKTLALPLPEGALISTYLVYSGDQLQADEQAWEVKHAGSVILDTSIRPGDRVDVLKAVSDADRQSVTMVAKGVRVLSVSRDNRELRATLAVTRQQAEALMTAENFAKQIRIVRNPMDWAPGTGG